MQETKIFCYDFSSILILFGSRFFIWIMSWKKCQHAIANSTAAIIQQFIPSLGLINIVSGVSAISSHETTRIHSTILNNIHM